MSVDSDGRFVLMASFFVPIARPFVEQLVRFTIDLHDRALTSSSERRVCERLPLDWNNFEPGAESIPILAKTSFF